MEFKDKLKSLRQSKNITQEELARKLYVTRQAVSKWEQGKSLPDIDSLKGISEYFGIAIDELLSSEQTKLIAVSGEAVLRKNRIMTLSALALCLLLLITAAIALPLLFTVKPAGSIWGDDVAELYLKVTALHEETRKFDGYDYKRNKTHEGIRLSKATEIYDEFGKSIALNDLEKGDYVTLLYLGGKPKERTVRITRTDKEVQNDCRGFMVFSGFTPPADLEKAAREKTVAGIYTKVINQNPDGTPKIQNYNFGSYSHKTGNSEITVYASSEELQEGILSFAYLDENGNPYDISSAKATANSTINMTGTGRTELLAPVLIPGVFHRIVNYTINVVLLKAQPTYSLFLYDDSDSLLSTAEITSPDKLPAFGNAAYAVLAENTAGKRKMTVMNKNDTADLAFISPGNPFYKTVLLKFE